MLKTSLKYKRILLKLSGEALMGNKQFGLDTNVMKRIALDINQVLDLGIEISIVVGGGNIFRGMVADEIGIERTTADYMGMIATVMNAVALQSVLEKQGMSTRVLSAIPMTSVCETYIRRRAMRHMEKGRVVIFAAGSGNPYFSTDTTSALRAAETNADVLIKATKVDGIYTSDPIIDNTAKKYDTISYSDVLAKNLRLMDKSSITIAQENKIPIVIFSILQSGGLYNVVTCKGNYSTIL